MSQPRYCIFTFRRGKCDKQWFSTRFESLYYIRDRFEEEGDGITRIVLCDLGERFSTMYYPGDKVI